MGKIVSWIAAFLVVIYLFGLWGEDGAVPENSAEEAASRIPYLSAQYAYAAENGISLETFSEAKKLSTWFSEQDFSEENMLYLDPDAMGLSVFFHSSTATKYKVSLYYGDYHYWGEVKDNRPHGYGMVTRGHAPGDNEKILYIGEFKDGFYDGYGLLFDEHNADNEEALGRLYSVTAPDYVTQYYNYVNYIIYEGEMDEGEMTGRGNAFSADLQYKLFLRSVSGTPFTIEDASYDILTGTFEKGEGAGDMKSYMDGFLLYEGYMSGGKYSGDGTQYYASSDAVRYEGDFKNGVYDGKGKYYSESGALLYDGKWSAGNYA